MTNNEPKIEAFSRDFNRWFTTQVATKEGVTLEVLPELVAIIYTRLRVWMLEDDARRLIREVVDAMEHSIAEGHIFMEMSDGTQVPYRSAEFYEDNPDARDMLIEMSWEMDKEHDFDQLLEDGNTE